MDKSAAIFLILAVHLYGGLATRVRITRHTAPVGFVPHVSAVPPLHVVHVNPAPHHQHHVHIDSDHHQQSQLPHVHIDSDHHQQPHVHLRPEPHHVPHVPHVRPHHPDYTNIQSTPYGGGAVSRGSGQLSGVVGGAAGAQSRDHKERTKEIDHVQSSQLLDDGYNRDSGFHNIYSKVEFGRSGQFDNDGRKNQLQSSLGQHNNYELDRNVADAVAHGQLDGQLDGHLDSYADYHKPQQQQQLHGNIDSHHDHIPTSAHHHAPAGGH